MNITTQIEIPNGKYCNGCRYIKYSNRYIGRICLIHNASLVQDGANFIKLSECGGF